MDSPPKPPISKLEETQAQVDQVVGIMRVNVEKVLEREENIKKLDSLADDVLESGKIFEQQALKIKRKYWWKNLKMWLILAIIVVVILAIIIGVLCSNNNDNSDATTANPNEKLQKSVQRSRSAPEA